MKHRFAALIAVSGLVAAVAAGHALAQRKAPGVQQGLWEIVISITDIGKLPRPPGFKFPTKGMHACMTQAQADDPVTFISMNVVPMGPECTPGPVRRVGNRANWPMQCVAPSAGQAAGGSNAYDFNPTAFEGTSRQWRPAGPAGSHEITVNITGKRIGDC